MDRIVDIAGERRHLSVLRGFLVVSEDRQEIGRIPLDDVVAVIVHAHGATWTANLVTALAERDVVLVVCAPNHSPVAVCLPLGDHHAQNARMRAQWDAGKPLHKTLWRRVVVGKIGWQAAVLRAFGHPAEPFDLLARKVKSGDPENVEAQAARRYWPLLMGEAFRRDRAAAGANALLNYGYTVLRALCARSVIAAGLHPAIGIHHAHRADAFALADDLIEPFRPLVDALVVRLAARGIVTLDPGVKRAMAGLIAVDLPGATGTTTVAQAAQRAAQSLAESFASGRAADLVLPQPPPPLTLCGLDRMCEDA